ncbi:hypothetical protein HPB49_015983 [Dermacentor silvarum]|uniref:Uncharacterized protein n=1 Tax=Dermacentor silvarum TaxID=543639 RepID=A0ACB8C4C9_DERSI|nr:hypothetical protein HPB49_015983 [Dermacentor silvarum]
MSWKTSWSPLSAADWVTTLRFCAFSGGLQRAVCYHKKTNNELTPDETVSLYECASLHGAMCPPVFGWDLVEETRELAEGGQVPHGLLEGDECNRIRELCRFPPASEPEARTFDRPTFFAVSGNTYLPWTGNTLEESIREEITRNEGTFQSMKAGAYALPYDFSRFDHQPRTDEVVGFQSVTFERALHGAHCWQPDDVILFEYLFEHEFHNTTVTSPTRLGEQRSFRVKTARNLANKFSGHGRLLDTWQIVRGDDTQVVPDSYVDVLGVKVGHDVLGAEVNEIKFTLRPGRTEFLRVETSDRASASYPLPNDPPPSSPSPPMPIDILNSTDFRAQQEAKRYQAVGVPLTGGEAGRLAEHNFRSRLALGDVLELAGMAVERITALSSLAAVRKKTLGKMLRQHEPSFYRKLQQVARRLMLRR